MNYNDIFKTEERNFKISPAKVRELFSNLPSNKQAFVQSGMTENTKDVFVSNTIDILIHRHTQSPKSTLGKLSIPKFDFNAYTLERPGPETTIRDLLLRIPIGTYKVQWHDTVLNKEFPSSFVLYNENVALDRYILIHIGNKPIDTEGCILLGKSQSPNWVGTSAETIYDFYALFKDIDTDEVRVKITESY